MADAAPAGRRRDPRLRPAGDENLSLSASLAALSKYEPLRPIFGGATGILLGIAFYATYRKPAATCAPGSLCETQGVDRMEKINRTALWIATVVALIVLTFPTWSAWALR